MSLPPLEASLPGPGGTANEQEMGWDFEGILHKTLLGGHDADLGVAGARPAKGEATEGSVVSPSCSNPLHVLHTCSGVPCPR